MNHKQDNKRKAIIVILCLSVFRLVLSTFFELGNDESYYWVYSQYLQWNYFDHPPVVAIWIRLFTLNLLLQDHTLFLRLGSVFSCAMASWFMYKTVCLLKDEKAGLISVVLFNASFYSGLTAGLLIMPDSPQIIFWTLCLWMITEISNDENNIKWWIIFGISAGLCIMSKVHGVYIWVGLGLSILIFNKHLFKNRGLYVALILTMIIVSPILIWNIQNNFVTYRFHSERIMIHGYLFNLKNFFKEAFLEFLVNNPINVILIISIFIWRRISKPVDNPVLKTFNLIGFSLILVVLFLSLFRDTRPIWSGPGYVTLIPITSCAISYYNSNVLKSLVKISLLVFIVATISILIFINEFPGTYGSKNEKVYGTSDISLDMYGWKEAGQKFQDFVYKENLKDSLKKSPMICNNWWGAHEEYYFCRPLQIKMIGLGSVMDLHEYNWTNEKREPIVDMTTALCIIHSDENYNALDIYKDYYDRVDTIGSIPIVRNTLLSHTFYILKLSGWKHNFPLGLRNR